MASGTRSSKSRSRFKLGCYSNEFYYQLVLIIFAILTSRVLVSLWGHSGEGKPPMHGDFEAQRHWMEITTNLPVSQWYVQGADNDLQYWGLDYPPLTAYHMMLNGYVAKEYKPEMMALGDSRGIENPDVKFFMRMSAWGNTCDSKEKYVMNSIVLLMDVLVFLPASVAFFIYRKEGNTDENKILSSILVLAAYPGLSLIDNGHFQYNNVSLGIVVLAVLALTLTYDTLAAILFCLALNYKQMELYHALPFFAYLFGRCIRLGYPRGYIKFAGLGFTVVATFALIWSPFLGSLYSATAVLQRLFPFNRGLYEDKVANFWCSISPIIKFKEIVSPPDMAKICMLVTGLFVLPSFIDLLRQPSIKKFHYALVNIPLLFFLFSFHVHEKSILIAAIPACLVITSDPLAVIWFLMISVFSMVPLLVKDGLLIPSAVSICIFWMSVNNFIKGNHRKQNVALFAMQTSLLGCVCLVLAALFIPPPQRFPDIFQLLIAIYACAHFFMFTFYFHVRQLGGVYENAIWAFLDPLFKTQAHRTD